MKRISVRFVTAAICVLLFVPEIFGQAAQPASSQASQPAPSSLEPWRVRLIPYFWGPDFKGRVGIGDRAADVDASFADIIRMANFGVMATLEADRNRFTTLVDTIYMNLSDEHATPGPLFSSADVVTKPFILTPVGGYKLIESGDSGLDVLGGIRFWRIDGELNLKPGILEGVDVSDSRNWVDGIFALKGRVRATPTWYFAGYGDIGGGGSNLTYQLLAVAGHDIGRRYALILGYRHLHVAYNKDRFLFNTGMGGPIIGLSIRFD